MPKKKGKNFSANNATGKRKKSDFYETPYTLTRKFLDVEEVGIDTDDNYDIINDEDYVKRHKRFLGYNIITLK